jgi:hypothetical protein
MFMSRVIFDATMCSTDVGAIHVVETVNHREIWDGSGIGSGVKRPRVQHALSMQLQ